MISVYKVMERPPLPLVFMITNRLQEKRYNMVMENISRLGMLRGR